MTDNATLPGHASTVRLGPGPAALAPGHAARQLGLKRGEFDLAVQLGRIRTLADDPHPPGGPPARTGTKGRVAQEEIDRLRDMEGFPEALRRRVRVVHAAQGAQLMEITAARFAKLARVGLVVPVKYYLNRYRAVVWLYLVEELADFASAEGNRFLLKGPLPEPLRSRLAAGADLRARNWRARHLGSLLRLTEDPWARAAVTASLLGPEQLAAAVPDPDERARLTRSGPDRPTPGGPGSLAAQRVGAITTADAPDEIEWLRASLGLCLAEARRLRSAPAHQEGGVARTPPPDAGPHSVPAGVPRAGAPRRRVTQAPAPWAAEPDTAPPLCPPDRAGQQSTRQPPGEATAGAAPRSGRCAAAAPVRGRGRIRPGRLLPRWLRRVRGGA